MREPAFTPGPWVLGSEGLAGTICVTADGDKVVCELDGFGCDVSPDARLIAAAPRMFAALVEAESRLRILSEVAEDVRLEGAPMLLPSADKCAAAISLALGESPNA